MNSRIDQMFELLPFTKPELVPGGYPAELFDQPNGIDKIGEFLKEGARELFRQNRGAMQCTSYIFCRRDAITSAPGDCLYKLSLTGDHDNDVAKEMFTTFIRGLVRITDARAASCLMEAWMLRTDGSRPEGSLEHVPGRIEVLIASLQTVEHQRLWSAPITRYARRGYHLSEFSSVDAGEFGGRFFNLMTPLQDPTQIISA